MFQCSLCKTQVLGDALSFNKLPKYITLFAAACASVFIHFQTSEKPLMQFHTESD